MIQTADHNEQLGHKIISHFPSLSVLLKAALEQDSKKGSIAHKLLKVELAVTLGLIFAQNPECRRHVHQELKAFPLWMSTLRSALLKHLSYAEVEYFADIVLVDSTGVNLVQSLSSSDSTQKQAMQQLFTEQEKRVQEIAANKEVSGQRKPKAMPESRSETALGKVKSLILSFAIHLTLSPKDGTSVSVGSPGFVINGTQPKPAVMEDVESDTDSIMSLPRDVDTPVSSQPPQRAHRHADSSTDDDDLDIPDNTVLSSKQTELARILKQQQELKEQEEQLRREAEEELIRMKRSQNLIHNSRPTSQAGLDAFDNTSETSETADQLFDLSRHSELRPQIPLENYDENTMRGTPQPLPYYIKEDHPESQAEHSFFENYGTTFTGASLRSRSREDIASSTIATAPSSGSTINTSQHAMSIATAHKKKLLSQEATQSRGFRAALSICKRFAAWYLDPSVRKRKETNQKETNKAIQQGTSISPTGKKGAMKHLLKNYIPTGDGLVMRRTSSNPHVADSNSPQKLQRSWTDEDVREGDVFEIEIPFDDFRIEVMEQVLQKMKKHHKLVKKMFITCPQGINARGRRTFLLDMNMNIMPRMCHTVQELIRLVKENGEERIKMPIYLWKGKERIDKSIANHNILEIIEYIKMYLANSADNHQQYIAENEYAEHVEEMLNEDDEEQRARQEEIAKREMQTLIDTSNASVMTPIVTWGKADERSQLDITDEEPRIRRLGDNKHTQKRNDELVRAEPSKVEVTELVVMLPND
jgi:hypothetical protein